MAVSVAGALRFERYDFFSSWIVKRVAADRGLEIDGRNDIEFTDRKVLERSVVRLVSGI
ncbi:MAG: hypothetical protein AB7E79_13585 [Rhodospirillaceae bacterium]